MNTSTNSLGILNIFLHVLACVLFLLAGCGEFFAPAPWPWSGRLVAWGLFFWCLSTVI